MYKAEYEAAFPLHYSIIAGDVEKVQSLLASGNIDINQKDSVGNTALHLAAKRTIDPVSKSGKSMMRCLLDAGANFNAQNNEGNTSLHYAAHNENLATIQLLLEAGADPSLENNGHQTPKYLAEGDIYVLLHQAEYEATFPLHHNIIVGNTENVSHLLRCGIDPNQPDKEGNTPLHYATLHGGRKMIELLLEKKANPLSKNNYGRTPKDLAEGDRKEFLEETISKQATNSLFILCTTYIALSSSIINKHIERGGDINGTFQDHRSAVVHNNGKNLLTRLVGLYSDQETLDSIKAKQILNMIKKVITCGADPYKQDDHGNSAMSIIEGMGQGTYQTNLLNATKNGLNNRQTSYVQPQASAQPPRTNMGVSGIERPSTSRGHSVE